MVEIKIVLAVLCLLLLIVVTSVRIRGQAFSDFELERRKRSGLDKNETERAQYIVDLLSIQRIISSLLLILSVLSLIWLSGYIIGIILSVGVVLFYGTLGHVRRVHALSQKWYEAIEPKLMKLIQKYPSIFSAIRSSVSEPSSGAFYSKEELLHMVSESGGVLTQDEKKLLTHALGFETRSVKEIMTPRSMIDTIKRHEILGPLVLDQLHKSGHSRFPVVQEDIDHIVGILYVRDVLTVDTTRKHTTKVDSAMRPEVLYIHEDQTLAHALAAIIKSHHHMLVVVNEFRETTGIITLEDVLEALIGKRIVDEFDSHEDLRAVAARNPNDNNTSAGAKDV